MKKWKNNLRIIRNLLFMKFVVLFLFILYTLSDLFIPLVFAFFLALLAQPLVTWLHEKRLSLTVSIVAVFLGVLIFFVLIDIGIYKTIKTLVVQKEIFIDHIATGMDSMVDNVKSATGYEINTNDLKGSLKKLLGQSWLLEQSGSFAGKIGKFSGRFFLTMFYFVGILGGVAQYERFIRSLSRNEKEDQSNLIEAYKKIQRSISTYIKVKTLVSFLTGVGYAIACYMFGIDFFLMWGILAFSLNYIPAVGSLLATIPPALLALLYFDSIGVTVIFILILITIQFVMGSVLDPYLMGRHLSLNIVTVILGVVFWGTLWGTEGMILSIPMMVIFKVFLEQLPDTNVIISLMERNIKDPVKI